MLLTKRFTYPCLFYVPGFLTMYNIILAYPVPQFSSTLPPPPPPLLLKEKIKSSLIKLPNIIMII